MKNRDNATLKENLERAGVYFREIPRSMFSCVIQILVVMLSRDVFLFPHQVSLLATRPLQPLHNSDCIGSGGSVKNRVMFEG